MYVGTMASVCYVRTYHSLQTSLESHTYTYNLQGLVHVHVRKDLADG